MSQHAAAGDPEAPYWAEAANGQLVYQTCGDCGTPITYAKEYCPRCAGRNLTWKPASGRGTVYTFSVVLRAPHPALRDRVPYVLALVELPEGIRRMTWIVDCAPADVQIGMPVRVVFRELDGQMVPFFAPETADQTAPEVKR